MQALRALNVFRPIAGRLPGLGFVRCYAGAPLKEEVLMPETNDDSVKELASLYTKILSSVTDDKVAAAMLLLALKVGEIERHLDFMKNEMSQIKSNTKF